MSRYLRSLHSISKTKFNFQSYWGQQMDILFVVTRDGVEFGRFSRKELVELAKSGKLLASDLVRRSDKKKTVSLAQIRGLNIASANQEPEIPSHDTQEENILPSDLNSKSQSRKVMLGSIFVGILVTVAFVGISLRNDSSVALNNSGIHANLKSEMVNNHNTHLKRNDKNFAPPKRNNNSEISIAGELDYSNIEALVKQAGLNAPSPLKSPPPIEFDIGENQRQLNTPKNVTEGLKPFSYNPETFPNEWVMFFHYIPSELKLEVSAEPIDFRIDSEKWDRVYPEKLKNRRSGHAVYVTGKLTETAISRGVIRKAKASNLPIPTAVSHVQGWYDPVVRTLALLVTQESVEHTSLKRGDRILNACIVPELGVMQGYFSTSQPFFGLQKTSESEALARQLDSDSFRGTYRSGETEKFVTQWTANRTFRLIESLRKYFELVIPNSEERLPPTHRRWKSVMAVALDAALREIEQRALHELSDYERNAIRRRFSEYIEANGTISPNDNQLLNLLVSDSEHGDFDVVREIRCHEIQNSWLLAHGIDIYPKWNGSSFSESTRPKLRHEAQALDSFVESISYSDFKSIRYLVEESLDDNFRFEDDLADKLLQTKAVAAARRTMATMTKAPKMSSPNITEYWEMKSLLPPDEAEQHFTRLSHPNRPTEFESYRTRYLELTQEPLSISSFFQTSFLASTIQWAKYRSEPTPLKHPDLDKMYNDLVERRILARDRFGSTLLAILDRLATLDAVTEFSSYLYDKDYDDAEWEAAINQITNRKREQLLLIGRREYYSPEEQKLMIAGSTEIDVPSQVFPPSEEAIKLAIAREVGNTPNGNTLNPGIYTITDPRISISVGKSLYKFQVKNIRFTKPPKLLEDGCTYRVSYESSRIVSILGNQRRFLQRNRKEISGGLIGKPFLKLLDGVDSVIETSDDFVLTKHGWQSKTVQQSVNDFRLAILSQD